MKHGCTPKTQDNCVFLVSRKTLVLGYHLHRETQYFHLHRETIFPLRETPEAFFRVTPNPPKQPMKEGNPRHLFPNLLLRVLKCPFRALSPCPIQILAGALDMNGVPLHTVFQILDVKLKIQSHHHCCLMLSEQNLGFL